MQKLKGSAGVPLVDVKHAAKPAKDLMYFDIISPGWIATAKAQPNMTAMYAPTHLSLAHPLP